MLTGGPVGGAGTTLSFVESLFDSRSADLIGSVILVVVVLVGRTVAVRYVRGQEWANVQMSRRWMVQIRNLALLLLIFGLTVIWAEQLRSAAISLVALGAAFVLATKELIMCVSGAVVRTSGKSFTIGDRIEVAGLRGDVVDHSLLTTTIFEVGPGEARTGRSIVFPNSLLVTNSVINETGGRDYVLHAFTVPVHIEGWRQTADLLLQAAEQATIPFVEQAAESFAERARRHSLALPSVQPQVVLDVTGHDSLDLIVRVPCPVRGKGRIEQEIIVRWLESIDPTEGASRLLDTSETTGMLPRINAEDE